MIEVTGGAIIIQGKRQKESFDKRMMAISNKRKKLGFVFGIAIGVLIIYTIRVNIFRVKAGKYNGFKDRRERCKQTLAS